MKSTGIVRNVDLLGRVVLPIELRRTYAINEGDPVEIFTDGEDIVIRKYSPGCQFCGTKKHLIVSGSLKACPACLKKLLGDK